MYILKFEKVKVARAQLKLSKRENLSIRKANDIDNQTDNVLNRKGKGTNTTRNVENNSKS